MFQRRIPLVGLLVFAAVVLLLTPEPASAQLRDRLRERFNSASTPTQTVVMPMATTGPATTVMTTTEMRTEGRRFRPLARRFGGSVSTTTTAAPTISPAPITNPPQVATPLAETIRRAFYPLDPANTAPVTSLITVRVPANAELMLEGQKTTATGMVRQFTSPPLERGSIYSYDIHAKWMENGREVHRTMTMSFQPGQEVNANFIAPVVERRRILR